MVSGMPDDTRDELAIGISRRSLLAAGALVLAGAGCASVSSVSTSGIERPHLRVGAIEAVTATGLYLAQQPGFFAADVACVTGLRGKTIGVNASANVATLIVSLVVTGEFPTGVNRVQIQRVADIVHQFGMLKTPFNVAPMIG